MLLNSLKEREVGKSHTKGGIALLESDKAGVGLP